MADNKDKAPDLKVKEVDAEDLPLTDKAEDAAVKEASEPVESEPDKAAPTTFELQFPNADK